METMSGSDSGSDSSYSPCTGLPHEESLACTWAQEVDGCMAADCRGCSGEQCSLCRGDAKRVDACCEKFAHWNWPRPEICQRWWNSVGR